MSEHSDCVKWRARAYQVSSLAEAAASDHLSTIEGELEIHLPNIDHLSTVQRTLYAMLLNLNVAARHYYPLGPIVGVPQSISIWLDDVRRGSTNEFDAVAVACLRITCEEGHASAVIDAEESNRFELGPVQCSPSDGVWDIALRLLEVMPLLPAIYR